MKISIKLKAQKRGFTIVETLVAIAVLMIAVAGPLTIANKALTAALYAKDQMAATYLAQESTEYLQNLRYNNLALVSDTRDWLYGIPTASCLIVGTACDASAVSSSPLRSDCPTGGCPLYMTSNSLYDHSGSGSSFFRRYFYIEPLNDDPHDALLTVVVTWNEGSIPNEVRLQSQFIDLGISTR